MGNIRVVKEVGPATMFGDPTLRGVLGGKAVITAYKAVVTEDEVRGALSFRLS